jgi:integrase
MLLEGNSPIRSETLQVATVCDLFLDYSLTNNSPSSYRTHRHFLQAFCTGYGRFNVSDLKPFHINRWVDGKKSWKGAKRHAIVSVKRVFSWAEQQGLIATNPIRSVKPPRMNRRERVLSADERKLILGSTKDQAFRDFLTAMLDTGCRPSEVAAVTAADVNPELGVWILKEHKTAKKTGKPRIIYLSPAMLDLSKKQIEKYPKGPLFPNTRGKPFSRNSWRCRFKRLRKRHPCLAGVVCYSLRHTYATDALVNGVGIAQVATLLGHTDTKMVASTYSHIAANVAHMREAAARATG